MFEANGNAGNFQHCILTDCRRRHYARGLCQPDYCHWVRAGRPRNADWTPRPKRQRLPESFKVFRG